MPWKKGQSGNPRGPRKGEKSFREILRDVLAEAGKREMETVKHDVTRNVIKLAKKGTPWAVHWVADRLEGKAVETINVEHKHSPLTAISQEDLIAIRDAARAIPRPPEQEQPGVPGSA